MTTSEVRAVSFDTLTGVGAIRVISRPNPHPARGQVVVDVRAATLNPVDLAAVLGRNAARMPGSAPWTPGWDLAGVVAEVGDGVDAGLVGATVLGFSQWYRTGHGTQASRVVLDVDNVAQASAVLGFEQLTTFGLNGLTALQALDAAGLSPGETLIVAGASGAVGSMVAELARLHELNVIPVGRTTEASELANARADAVINCGPRDESVLAGLRDGGIAISLTGAFESSRDIRTERLSVRVDKRDLEEVVRLAESGALTSRIGRSFPVERAAEAYQYLLDSTSHDRVVIVF